MKKLFVILAMVALGCLPAAADTIRFDGTGGASQGGVYTAPYFLSVNGGTDIGAMCIDFHHHITAGEGWQANITNLGSADLSQTRLGSGGFNTYREEAWLYNEFVTGAAPSGDINFAAWAIISPDVIGGSGWTAGAQHWYNLATTTDLTSFDSAMVHFNIITPTVLGGDSAQEFITETPEPGGLVLVGSGLLGLAGLVRKKIK